MIEDWSEAYSNAPIIPDAESYPDRWLHAAAGFREDIKARSEIDLAYGDDPRHRFDLFHPKGSSNGLVVFIHGGYWMTFGKKWWSHLARGAVDRGWSVAIPQYTLAPDARIATITRETGAAVAAAAARVEGPIRLSGHSAGGHLVCRMVCRDGPLAAELQARVAHVLSISGVHDLRPLMRTKLNETLNLDHDEAARETPALLEPVEGTRLTAWVGGAERPEFLRQTDLIANIWYGLGADTKAVHEPQRHHFDVVEGLANSRSALCAALLD